jgi:hypothetical protein
MAKILVASHALGVLTFATRKAASEPIVVDGREVFPVESVTCTATMPDANVIPAAARKALEGTRRESAPLGVTLFVRGEDAPAKATK